MELELIQLDLINLMWNWGKLELSGIGKMELIPSLSDTLIPLIHLIAFKLNNSYTWLVSWENSQAGILLQDPSRAVWFGLLMIDVSNGST